MKKDDFFKKAFEYVHPNKASSDTPRYDNEPFFQEKLEAAKEHLTRVHKKELEKIKKRKA